MKLENVRESLTENELLLALLGEVLTKCRKLKNMSQSQLAEAAHINRPYISDIERGLRNVSLLTIDSICSALGCAPAEVLQEVYVLYKLRGERKRRRSEVG
jgi:transcriptional regulator with XRE-family HTH domain